MTYIPVNVASFVVQNLFVKFTSYLSLSELSFVYISDDDDSDVDVTNIY